MARARLYSNVTKRCNLCITEKFFIICKPGAAPEQKERTGECVPAQIHIKLKDCLDLRQNEEATCERHQWLSIRLRLWIPLDCWIHHFSYTANSKYRWRKNIRVREKSVYTAKLSGFKSSRTQSSHFIFWTRRHDQTGMFLFRIRPLVCKRRNQSGTKTYRIHDESGTISSSVNLVV